MRKIYDILSFLFSGFFWINSSSIPLHVCPLRSEDSYVPRICHAGTSPSSVVMGKDFLRDFRDGFTLDGHNRTETLTYLSVVCVCVCVCVVRLSRSCERCVLCSRDCEKVYIHDSCAFLVQYQRSGIRNSEE